MWHELGEAVGAEEAPVLPAPQAKTRDEELPHPDGPGPVQLSDCDQTAVDRRGGGGPAACPDSQVISLVD